MTDFRLYPATPLDAAPPAVALRWRPNGSAGARAGRGVYRLGGA